MLWNYTQWKLFQECGLKRWALSQWRRRRRRKALWNMMDIKIVRWSVNDRLLVPSFSIAAVCRLLSASLNPCFLRKINFSAKFRAFHCQKLSRIWATLCIIFMHRASIFLSFLAKEAADSMISLFLRGYFFVVDVLPMMEKGFALAEGRHIAVYIYLSSPIYSLPKSTHATVTLRLGQRFGVRGSHPLIYPCVLEIRTKNKQKMFS